MQEILDFSNRRTVIELSGTYWSVDEEWNDVQLSGKVVLPADGKAERIILVSHYTIGSNAEAPSRCFPIEAMLAKMGYVMIFPDYLGYGVTADRVHPYLVMDLTAINVLDMYLAVRPFLEAAGVEVAHDEILLMGYSQGGATTMAVQNMIETVYDDEIRERIDSMFEIMMKDDEKGKILNKKGLYEDRQINECKLNSQELFYKMAYGEIK